MGSKVAAGQKIPRSFCAAKRYRQNARRLAGTACKTKLLRAGGEMKRVTETEDDPVVEVPVIVRIRPIGV